MCAYSADKPEQGKSSFLEGMLTQSYDGQEEPHESCWRIGFTCAPGNISISKKPGGLQHWRLATKDLFVELWFVLYTVQ